MQTLSEHLRAPKPAEPDSPFYVRWDSDKVPFAVEFRLDVISAIRTECERGSNDGREIGGILLGTPPVAGSQVLRVNEIRSLPSRAGDQKLFIPDPRQHDHFVAARWESANSGRTPVGFFRTHLRGGPLRPSIADRTLLGGEFENDPYLLLLIEAPRQGSSGPSASLFAGSRGQVSEEPIVAPFAIDPSQIRSLPEAEPDRTAQRKLAPPKVAVQRGISGYVALVVLFLTILAAAYVWSGLPQAGLGRAVAATDPELSVSGGHPLRITWDQTAGVVAAADTAKLTIVEGDVRRELLISAAELRNGSIEYQNATNSVQVTLTFPLAKNVSITQTALWHN
jgi:hypothetical protein